MLGAGHFNPINIRLTADDVAYILNHSESCGDLLPPGLRPPGRPDAAGSPRYPALRRIEGQPGEALAAADHDYEALLAAASPAPREPAVDEDDVAEIFYTSGTTGQVQGRGAHAQELYLNAFNFSTAIGLKDATRCSTRSRCSTSTAGAPARPHRRGRGHP